MRNSPTPINNVTESDDMAHCVILSFLQYFSVNKCASFERKFLTSWSAKMFNSLIIAYLLHILQIILIGLILIIVSAIIGFYCYYKYAHWNDDFWPLRNVPLILRNEFISVWDQFMLKFRAYEIDLQIYHLMKIRNLKFVGLMEFQRPVMYIRDLDLIKAITIKDFEYFVNHRSVVLLTLTKIV